MKTETKQSYSVEGEEPSRHSLGSSVKWLASASPKRRCRQLALEQVPVLERFVQAIVQVLHRFKHLFKAALLIFMDSATRSTLPVLSCLKSCWQAFIGSVAKWLCEEGHKRSASVY